MRGGARLVLALAVERKRTRIATASGSRGERSLARTCKNAHCSQSELAQLAGRDGARACGGGELAWRRGRARPEGYLGLALALTLPTERMQFHREEALIK